MKRALRGALLALLLAGNASAVPYRIVYQEGNAVDGGAPSQLIEDATAITIANDDVVAIDKQGNPTNLTNGAYGTIERAAARADKVAFHTAGDVFAPSGLSWTNVTNGTVANPILTPGGVNASGEAVFARSVLAPDVYHWDGATLNTVTMPGGTTSAFLPAILDDGRIGFGACVGGACDYWLDGVEITDDPLHSGYSLQGAASVNQSGQVAVISSSLVTSHLFFWDGAALRDISAETGVEKVVGTIGINDAGHLLFIHQTLQDIYELYLWDGTDASLIGHTVPSPGNSSPGFESIALGEKDEIYFSTVNPGEFVLAGESPPPDNDSFGSFAFSSNAATGTAWLLAQATVPEPSSFEMLLLAFGGLAVARNFKEKRVRVKADESCCCSGEATLELRILDPVIDAKEIAEFDCCQPVKWGCSFERDDA